MPCSYKGCEVWSPNIGGLGEQKQYRVELTRDIGFCGDERNELFINGVKVVNHGYVHNKCSPLCGVGGEYEWQSEGHTFLLMFNSLACSTHKDHRLFVDGIDVNTGREFSEYWRHRGWIFFFFGLVLFVIGAICIICFFTIDAINENLNLDGKLRISLPFIGVGLVEMVIGLIPICKFRKPRYDPDQGQHQWPSGYDMNTSVQHA